jgi:hypothetical protein
VRVSALLVLCLVGTALAADAFVNTKIKRTIDASQHTVSVRTDFTVDVTGSSSTYVFSLPVEEASHVAYLRVKQVSPSSSTLSVKKLPAMYAPGTSFGARLVLECEPSMWWCCHDGVPATRVGLNAPPPFFSPCIFLFPLANFWLPSVPTSQERPRRVRGHVAEDVLGR